MRRLEQIVESIWDCIDMLCQLDQPEILQAGIQPMAFDQLAAAKARPGSGYLVGAVCRCHES